MMEDTSQALIRVQNDRTDVASMVYLENGSDNAVPLGKVEPGVAENFVLPVESSIEDYRLIARTPTGEQGEEAILLSDRFYAEGNMTITWFMVDNELEVN